MRVSCRFSGDSVLSLILITDMARLRRAREGTAGIQRRKPQKYRRKPRTPQETARKDTAGNLISQAYIIGPTSVRSVRGVRGYVGYVVRGYVTTRRRATEARNSRRRTYRACAYPPL